MSDRSIVALTRPMDRIRSVVDRLADIAPVIHLDAPPVGIDRAEIYRVEAALRQSAIQQQAAYQAAIEAGDAEAADRAFAALVEATRVNANALLEAQRAAVVAHNARAAAVRRLFRTGH